jgi:hypothetical protein
MHFQQETKKSRPILREVRLGGAMDWEVEEQDSEFRSHSILHCWFMSTYEVVMPTLT